RKHRLFLTNGTEKAIGMHERRRVGFGETALDGKGDISMQTFPTNAADQLWAFRKRFLCVVRILAAFGTLAMDERNASTGVDAAGSSSVGRGNAYHEIAAAVAFASPAIDAQDLSGFRVVPDASHFPGRDLAVGTGHAGVVPIVAILHGDHRAVGVGR